MHTLLLASDNVDGKDNTKKKNHPGKPQGHFSSYPREPKLAVVLLEVGARRLFVSPGGFIALLFLSFSKPKMTQRSSGLTGMGELCRD